MSIRSSCQNLTIRALWLAAATTASGGCVLLNPSYGSTGAGATEATGDGASTTAEGPTTAASTTAEDSTTAAEVTGATTDAETSTTSPTGTDGSTGDELCPECAAEKLACDASLACGLVSQFAEDCDYDRVCINNLACDSLPIKKAAEGLTLWGAIERCDAAECMEIPPSVCVADQEACYANPACVEMSACVSSKCSCLPDSCVLHCWAECGAAHPAGVEDWQDSLGCIAEQVAGDGLQTPRAIDARAR